jgi:hypothetical protein
MQPVSPVIPNADVSEVTYAKDQPEYLPLPAVKLEDGTVLTRWVLSEEEKRRILEQGYIYLEVLTFNRPLQPLRLSAEVPDGFNSVSIAQVWPDTIQ